MKKRHLLLIEYFLFLILGCLLLNQLKFLEINIIYLLISILFFIPFLLKIKQPYLPILFHSLLSLNSPSFTFFIPATFYLCLTLIVSSPATKSVVFFLSGVIILVSPLEIITKVILVLYLGIGTILTQLHQENDNLKKEKIALVDDSWEREEKLATSQHNLRLDQEHLIELKIMAERNRIARDIHDQVGHLLSSSLLQLGALETLNQDATLEPLLVQLKKTTNQGMDNIRWSVHNLYDHSLTLTEGVRILLTTFEQLPIEVKGVPFERLSEKETRELLMVLKESLTNIKKHSNATLITISFTELPGFYQVKIKDNGTDNSLELTGIGLITMRQRVETIGGQLYVQAEKTGFTVQIVLSKGGEKNETSHN
ncbi:sensor histidine kinase [Vagococcus sp.]|uniref:sensor histidine kinase n=1 Tax=Vagococcus sp. TaxID=1933889 RepID=UPI003F94C6A1